MNDLMRTAHSRATSVDGIVCELKSKLGAPPVALTLFFAPERPGEEIARCLGKEWPETAIVGCSTAGEIATGTISAGAVSAAAFGPGLVRRRAVALADFRDGVESGVARAVAELEREFGSLKRLDPATHVGVILIDSTHRAEEATHVALGNRAPLLSFVGGSAADNILFERTRVLAGEGATAHGAALMLLEVSRPFRVIKACHFGPTETSFTVTRTDGRWLLELDRRPAAEVYAEYVGCRPEQLSYENLFLSPLGIMIDGEPWLRQVSPPFQKNGAILLGCSVTEGNQVSFMKPRVDLVSHLQSKLAAVRAELGEIQGGLLYDCVLRRLELEANKTSEAYARCIDFPAAGFYTHGESWLGHMHQTLTALFFG